MTNAVIYYKMVKFQNTEDVITIIRNFIKKITEEVVGVYIDPFDKSDSFNTMVNEGLGNLDFLYLNKVVEDDFEDQLILQLSKTMNFNIVYFEER